MSTTPHWHRRLLRTRRPPRPHPEPRPAFPDSAGNRDTQRLRATNQEIHTRPHSTSAHTRGVCHDAPTSFLIHGHDHCSGRKLHHDETEPALGRYFHRRLTQPLPTAQASTPTPLTTPHSADRGEPARRRDPPGRLELTSTAALAPTRLSIDADLDILLAETGLG